MYETLKQGFRKQFGREAEWIFSAPGRTELSGNHTDHQHGCVLAAAVDLDTRAAVGKNGGNAIRVLSEGYPLCEVALDELTVRPEEKNTTAALVRGVAARFAQLGCELEGFDAYVTSTVLPGSGLSSSAAFEVLLGTIVNMLFNASAATPVQIAQIGQVAAHFGDLGGRVQREHGGTGFTGHVGLEVLIVVVTGDGPYFNFIARFFLICLG